MLFLESVYVSFFLMAVVFFVLFCLYLSIKLFSFLLGKFNGSGKTKNERGD